jgi:hypothetical protein
MAKPVYTKETIQREAVALVANYGTARNAAAAIYQQTRGLKGGPVARHTVEMWISDVMTGVDVDAPTAERPRIYTKGTLTRALAESLVREHGTASAAAAAIAPFTRNRLGKGNVDPTTIKSWFSDVLADSDSARNTAARRAENTAGHPILEDAYSNEDLNRLARLLETANVPVSAIKTIDQVKLKSYGVFAKVKDKDGNETLDTKALYSTSLVLSPNWEDGPAWPVVQPGAVGKLEWNPSSEPVGEFAQRVFFIPDIQIGYYRNIVTMKLEPFHDLAAIDCMLQMLRDFRPTRVVILGDFLDCASLSRYLQVPEFQLTLQPSIYYGTALLQKARELAGPDCEFDFLEGNHERRVAEMIAINAKSAYGLRRGTDTPEAWPVLSIQNLLCFDALRIRCSTPYPSGQVWVTSKLVAQHQDPKSTDIRATIIHGHQERRKNDSRTVHYQHGSETYDTWCFPGLGRIDDVAEPTQLQRTSVPSDRTRKNANQGLGVAYVFKSGSFHIEPVKIERGFGVLAGKPYQGRALSAKRLREVA